MPQVWKVGFIKLVLKHGSFIIGRNIVHNVLNVQTTMDYTQHTHMELIIMQLYLERAYDHVNWSIAFGLMHTLNCALGHIWSKGVSLMNISRDGNIVYNSTNGDIVGLHLP